ATDAPTALNNLGAASSSALANKADDSTVVHLAGSETVTGAKDFTGGLTVNGGSVVSTATNLGGSLTGNLPNAGVTRFLPFTQSGTLTVQTGTLRFRFPTAVTIDSVALTVGTAPTGA